MFHRLLIANRGEVAVRIARAARDLGVAPIGVASKADLGASWLDQMEDVVVLGPAAARDSYLSRERLLQAALQTRATALHPGWGFLAEDARFAALCGQHGIAFVGPQPALIARMGLKTPAKRAMGEAGLDVIPGSDGPLDDLEQARTLADEAGYPVLIKADAGGGGRGMRRVDAVEDLEAAYNATRAEAEGAFGSAAVYLEKFLIGGRHIEVQVVGDAFGNAVHLGERDCSIQRRHQKLIEEAPSPMLSDAERTALGERSAEAVRALGYRNAGTIEYLRANDGQLYFMEMNTRLQVEHPVSECITGVDLAQLQLSIAANRPLGLTQDEIRFEGHAIECRINAEDPSDDFRPTPGTLTAFEFPTDRGPGRVRVDTHLRAGDEVSPHYDSLLAKVIVHASDRTEAIATMIACLQGATIEGVKTTIPLHLGVLGSKEFASGDYDTTTLPGWKA
ncbi:MAG: biotin carboxylase N-terminal domain-containing protein [Planctomycetota bacterium]